MGIFKKLIIFYLFVSFFQSPLIAQGIIGFWQTVDKESHLPTSVIAIYPYQGKYYGKIVASYNDQGVVSETIDKPQSRAKGITGNPYYCGLDIIRLTPPIGTETAKGYIVDPRSGKTYHAKVWVENGNLVLRGELLMFGRNETLEPFQNFSTCFEKPDMSTFTPSH